MLAERQELTTNPLSQGRDLSLQRPDVYVPLGLVERRQRPQPQPRQQTDQALDNAESIAEREEETITPIAEDEFFQQVLQRGQSPKSQGRRLAIISEPGSGKTTRLQAIAAWILAQNLGIPIFPWPN
jgi:predicted NACHT family NTPase